MHPSVDTSPDQWFNWAGELIGRVIRVIVSGLAWFFTHIFGALDSFYTGLADELGIGRSTTGFVILLIGLLLLASGARSLMAGRIVSSFIVGGLGVLLLVWLIG